MKTKIEWLKKLPLELIRLRQELYPTEKRQMSKAARQIGIDRRVLHWREKNEYRGVPFEDVIHTYEVLEAARQKVPDD